MIKVSTPGNQLNTFTGRIENSTVTRLCKVEHNINANGRFLITPPAGYNGIEQLDLLVNVVDGEPLLADIEADAAIGSTTIIDVPDGYSGIRKVTVVVPEFPRQQKTVNALVNHKSYEITPDAGKLLEKVTVNVDIPSDVKNKILPTQTFNANGSYKINIPDGFTGLAPVTVNVALPFTDLVVKSNGTYEGMYRKVTVSVPDLNVKNIDLGTYIYNTNGIREINVPDGYTGISHMTIKVDVPTGNTTVTKTYTQNGTYYLTPPSGYNGFNQATIKVAIPDRDVELEPLNKEITANGTYNFSPSEGKDGFGSAKVIVKVPESEASTLIDGTTALPDYYIKDANGNWTRNADAYDSNGYFKAVPTEADGFKSLKIKPTDAMDSAVEYWKDKGLKNDTFTANGTYTAGDGYDGFKSVTVNVATEAPNLWTTDQLTLPAFCIQDSDGKWIQNPEYPDDIYTIKTPEGYDGIESVGVDMWDAISSAFEFQKSKLESLEVTENGTYSRANGYNKITVNVPSEASSFDLTQIGFTEARSEQYNTLINNSFTSGNVTTKLFAEKPIASTSRTDDILTIAYGVSTVAPKAGLFKNNVNLMQMPAIDNSIGADCTSMYENVRCCTGITLVNSDDPFAIFNGKNMFRDAVIDGPVPKMDLSASTDCTGMFAGAVMCAGNSSANTYAPQKNYLDLSNWSGSIDCGSGSANYMFAGTNILVVNDVTLNLTKNTSISFIFVNSKIQRGASGTHKLYIDITGNSAVNTASSLAQLSNSRGNCGIISDFYFGGVKGVQNSMDFEGYNINALRYTFENLGTAASGAKLSITNTQKTSLGDTLIADATNKGFTITIK